MGRIDVDWRARMEAAARRGVRSAPALERAFHVTLGLPLGEVTALVPLFLAAGERELDLRPAVAEVELRRDKREAPLPDLAGERVDLLAAKEELPVAVGIVVLAVPLVVDRDVGADEPGLVPAHVPVRLLERGPALAERLHLGAGQDETGLDSIQEVVVVPRPAVVDDQLLGSGSHPASVEPPWASLSYRRKAACGVPSEPGS